MHLLVIEDERALCETIVRSLRRLAYSVDYCYDGEKALELLGVECYDLVLLDLNLPKKDGMTVLRALRQTDRETRVLILSARSEVEDKVQGLDAGANDYLAKPFHLAELEARIRSLTLRQFTQQDVLLSCGGLSFDTRSRTAAVNGQTLTLTRKETGILEYLMVHQGRPVSQEELMDHVWDNSVDSFSNSIRVHISALRKKLRAVLGYDPIRNRIGEGYLMGGEEVMKRLSLQWRITLMSVLLIGITCVAMNLLLCSSGVYYMDTIADSLQGGGTVILNDSGAASFDPQLIAPNEELTIVVDGVQGRFRTTNWYITAAVTLLSGILAYFVSGRALKPLRSFTSQVEQVQLNNLADMRIDEDSISEFRQLSRSFNQMLERLNNAFAAQRQFTGNAAHELRTPLALMQAQLELFSAEHPDVRPETAEFLTLLREQTERLTQMTKTLLEMSNLQQVARNEQLQLAPMVEEIFTDLASLAEKRSITLEAEGDAALTGSDALIYRMLFNLTENAVKYNRLGGSVRVELAQGQEKCIIRVSDTGCGIPEEYQRSIFHPFFRVDKSRSREYGGAGLGLSLVWEIADLHGGSVWVEESSDKGTTIAVELPAGAEKTAQAMASRCFCPPDRVDGCASLYS